MTSKYNQVMVDDTGSDEANRWVTTTSYAIDLMYSSLIYKPTNIGLPATYSFALQPTLPFLSSAFLDV